MRSIALLICLFAAAARAEENDLELWKLGHPDPLGCTACNGTPGDVPEPADPNAQARFHRMASTLGMAFAPAFHETAGTLGQSGFEVSVSANAAFLKIPADSWPTQSATPPSLLTLPTVTMRKGLGGSFELGAAVAWLANSQMMALSGELRWALVDGIAFAPDVALRAWGTRVIGTQELDLTMAGADAQLSKSFGVAGMMRLQPYGHFGVVMINALSTVVDFKPGVEHNAKPTEDDGIFRTVSMLDNRFLRAGIGFRLVTGAVVLGVEGGVAWGTNPVQSDPLPGGAAVPTNYVRLYNLSAKLGFGF